MAHTNGTTVNGTLLKCLALPGIFSDEWMVSFTAIESPDREITANLFVEKRLVDLPGGEPQGTTAVNGLLHVACIEREGGLAAIILPQSAVPVGELAVVRESELE